MVSSVLWRPSEELVGCNKHPHAAATLLTGETGRDGPKNRQVSVTQKGR